jgi:hypothetical protein
MEDPPFSLDSAQNDILLFPKIKSVLKGQFHDTDFQKYDNGTESYSIAGVPKKCFQQWQHCWAKCITAKGEYFEGDPLSNL